MLSTNKKKTKFNVQIIVLCNPEFLTNYLNLHVQYRHEKTYNKYSKNFFLNMSYFRALVNLVPKNTR